MAPLVEGFPGDGVQKRKPVYQTQVDLGSELGLCPGFPTYDGTDVGLIYAHYPIFHLMAFGVKHLQLLGIYGLDDPILLLQPVSERENAKAVKLFFNRPEVPSQVLKLGFDAVTDDFSGWVSVLGYLQKPFSGYFSVSPGLLSLWTFRMQFINDCFCDLPGFVQQPHIGGIGDVLGAGSGIIDHFTFVGRGYRIPIGTGRGFIFFFTVLS